MRLGQKYLSIRENVLKYTENMPVRRKLIKLYLHVTKLFATLTNWTQLFKINDVVS